MWAHMNGGLWCFYCTKTPEVTYMVWHHFMQLHCPAFFGKKNMDVMIAKVWRRVVLQGLPVGALSIVKVLSNETSRNSCRKLCCSSLQGSLSPSLCAEVQLVFAALGFTLLLLKLFPEKPLSTHITKLLSIFTQKVLMGPQLVAASNICHRCFCSWEPLGFPLRPRHSLPRGGWRGAAASSPRAAPAGFSGI